MHATLHDGKVREKKKKKKLMLQDLMSESHQPQFRILPAVATGTPRQHRCAYIVGQCLRGVLCAWRVREVSLQIIHKGPLGKHNNQGGRLVPRQ